MTKENIITETLNAFPTEFFGITFPKELITPLYNEVLEKKDEIKRISDMHAGGDTFIPDDYWTDYRQPVTLDGWEKLIPYVSDYFSDFNCSCFVYWTAIYGKYGVHAVHHHTESIFETKVANFSCVLYLTNVGSTTFFNPNTHNVTEPFLNLKSQLGKLIIFPANIIHTSNPHNLDREKIIISANWQIIKK